MPPVPIYVKGGVWSNIEDQILKAAIQKYGTHQWSKVASLLQKKTAKQCESRWTEYLNPNLNFKEFSKEEDAKLLELSRRLPNQWRTIADIMGRTAQLCIDRYNKLLEGDDAELGLTSSLELQVGDINIDAETKPAKPDKDELDDDEREMLAEARARLLNTQGKKATRKIRERMLEESKRVAHLQKRRELKQAGVDFKIKAPKKKYDTQIDYNADIIYEQEPAEGIYDTSREDERAARDLANFERSVSRKGLNDDKQSFTKGGASEQKRSHEEAFRIKAENTFVNNELKKPKLELPDPHSVTTEDLQAQIDTDRHQILQLKPDSHIIADSSPIKNTQKEPSYFRKPKKSILSLFAKLPKPRNDFEIVLDDDSDSEVNEQVLETTNSESKETQLTVASQNVDLDDTTARKSKIISMRNDLPFPEPIVNPKTPIDKEFVKILVSSLAGTRLEIDSSSSKLRERIERKVSEDLDRTSTIYQEVTEKLVKDRKENPETLKSTIENYNARISALKESLQRTSELDVENGKVSNNVIKKTLPDITQLQQDYFAHYRMYQNEYYAIAQRKQKLQELISDASGA